MLEYNLCNDSLMLGFLSIVKNILLLVQILGPILCIFSLIYTLIKMAQNPDDKKIPKRAKNSVIALALVFFIPTIVNALLGLVSPNTTLGSCWKSAHTVFNSKSEYIDLNKDKNKTGIINDTDSYEKGVSKVGVSTLDYSGAKTIPNSALENASHSNLSIVVVSEDGRVLAERQADLLREGGSTVKVFTGLAAVKLLDPATDTIVSTEYAQNMPYMGDPDVTIGQKFTVSQAATRDFPGSSNITTANIAIAIGKKKGGATTEEDAYFKGMDIINNYIREIGCTKSKLPSSSGVNYIYHLNRFTNNNNGISTGEYGITANDLALVTINAMKDENFSKGINYGKNGICNPPYKNTFFIKSGTQAYCHGVWGFDKDGKRYYVVILGVNCKNSGDDKCQIFRDIYNWSINTLF